MTERIVYRSSVLLMADRRTGGAGHRHHTVSPRAGPGEGFRRSTAFPAAPCQHPWVSQRHRWCDVSCRMIVAGVVAISRISYRNR